MQVDWNDLGPVMKVKEVSRYLVKKGKIAALKDGRTFRIYTEALKKQLLGQGG